MRIVSQAPLTMISRLVDYDHVSFMRIGGRCPLGKWDHFSGLSQIFVNGRIKNID